MATQTKKRAAFPMKHFDAIIIGAGAAGMFCAAEAGQRGRRILVIDHARAPGEKIRISGGGRCNFTNIHATPAQFLSRNPHFCISALKRFTPRDFIARVERHGIAYHEKTAGQLFCDHSAKDIITMLVTDCRAAGVEIRLSTPVARIDKTAQGFAVVTGDGAITADTLVIATGGKSIPKIGATGFAYEVARQFGHAVIEPRPGLVPLTFGPDILEKTAPLAGISLDAAVRHGKTSFSDGLVFTHRGLSGPSILQISSYWREGEEITVALAPAIDIAAELTTLKAAGANLTPANALARFLPKRLARWIAEDHGLSQPLQRLADKQIETLGTAVNQWRIKPVGTEGYRTAEVTLGGVDTDGLHSQTMASRAVPGLYFIGEAVDVTGWLGGYNFQWAWSSGWAAGQAL